MTVTSAWSQIVVRHWPRRSIGDCWRPPPRRPKQHKHRQLRIGVVCVSPRPRLPAAASQHHQRLLGAFEGALPRKYDLGRPYGSFQGPPPHQPRSWLVVLVVGLVLVAQVPHPLPSSSFPARWAPLGWEQHGCGHMLCCGAGVPKVSSWLHSPIHTTDMCYPEGRHGSCQSVHAFYGHACTKLWTLWKSVGRGHKHGACRFSHCRSGVLTGLAYQGLWRLTCHSIWHAKSFWSLGFVFAVWHVVWLVWSILSTLALCSPRHLTMLLPVHVVVRTWCCCAVVHAARIGQHRPVSTMSVQPQWVAKVGPAQNGSQWCRRPISRDEAFPVGLRVWAPSECGHPCSPRQHRYPFQRYRFVARAPWWLCKIFCKSLYPTHAKRRDSTSKCCK